MLRLRRVVIGSSFLWIGLVLAGTASAQSSVYGSAELAFRSKYLFAGIPFAADEVTQAKVTVGIGSVTLNGFAVYDHDAGEVTEADLWGDYYVQASDEVGVFFGAALYNFRYDEWEATPEIYGGLVLSAPLNPTLYVAHDFDLGDGTHAMLMLSHDVPVGDQGVVLGLAGNLDYNDDYYVEVSGFSYADVSATLSIPAGALTISPMVLTQVGIDDVFEDETLFGLTLAYAF